MNFLDTKTKAKSTLLTVLVAVANTVGVGYGLPALTIPQDATETMMITTVIIWLLNVVILYAPTIVTMVASRTYIKAKTEQNVAGIQAGTLAPTPAAPTPSPAASRAQLQQPVTEPVSYLIPPDLTSLWTNPSNPFLNWEQFEGMLGVNLTSYSPQVRMDFALDILKEDKARLDTAWYALMGEEKASPVVEPPTAEDFLRYDANQEYQKKVRDAIPGCAWISDPMHQILIGYGKYYDGLEWTQKLQDKTINWNLANSIEGFVLHQYAAVVS